MKGITPVISIILLIMITIGIIGFFFVFFSSFTSEMFNQTETHGSEQQRIMALNAEFVSVGVDDDNVTAIVRNTGSVSIRKDELVIIAEDSAGEKRTYTYPYVIDKGSVASVITADRGIPCNGNRAMTLTIDLYGSKDKRSFGCSEFAYFCLGGDQLVGDANNDRVIDTGDVTAIRNAIYYGIGGQPICCGDVNDDGVINETDITEIKNYFFGITNCFLRGYSCSQKENCTDGIDNDCDGDEDCDDNDCAGDPTCS